MDWRSRLYNNYVTSGQIVRSSTRYINPSPYINYVIKNHIPEDRSVRILDLGCGSGDFLHWLKTAGYVNLQGVDLSPEMVSMAHAAGINEVRIGDLRQSLVELAAGSVDVILAIDVLEHFDRQNLFALVDQIYRVLSESGKVVIHVPNASGLFGSKIRYGDLTHELAFTPSSIRQLLQTVGFTNIKCFEDRPIPHGLKSILRALLWEVTTVWYRLASLAETGSTKSILSQNLLATATKIA